MQLFSDTFCYFIDGSGEERGNLCLTLLICDGRVKICRKNNVIC